MAINHAQKTPHVLLSSPINRDEFHVEKKKKREPK
jgi:hypothetical protein